MDILFKIFIVYLLIINVIGFAIMGIDKKRSIKKEWRIKEATLFIIALIGGGIGSVFGMYSFRHKTKHWYFVVGMPLIAILNAGIILWICKYMAEWL